MKRTIPQGQFTHPYFAAESFVGERYSIDGVYSANPADYWNAPDDRRVGAIVGPIALRTTTGRVVVAPRVLKTRGTIGDLRRLARAAASLVRA